MKWTCMAALVLTLAAGSLATAVEPTPATIRMPNTRGSLFNSGNWWTRYGEPVNQAAIDAAPAEAVATPVGWHENGHGYIYGLGACDYTPPCTDWQWKDYNPMPWRCWPLHERWNHGHCGRCGHCGDPCGGHCGCSKAMADCGCAAPAPACADKVPACDAAPSCEAAHDCGCDVAHKCCVKNHFHWHWKHKCFWHKHCGCDTCSAPVDCGCAAPVVEMPAGPEQAPPKPIADESQKAAFAWPFGPVR